jgi:hypothetical protein
MSTDRRHDAATAGTGAALLAGGAVAQHHGLDLAYGKDSEGRPNKRPHQVTGKFRDRFLEQKKLLHTSHGRLHYVSGAGAILLGGSALATGIDGLASKRDSEPKPKRRRSLLVEGVSGVRESMDARIETARHPAPKHLVAGSYLGGLGIAAGAGGLTHNVLGRTKVPGSLRSGAAVLAGATAGAVSLPVQSKLIGRASRGKYEATPVGVRRRKPTPIVKLDANYRGKDMTSGQKRARVMGASGIPIIPFAGDIAAASTAASMAPPELRKKTAALQFGGAQAGGTALGVAGAYGLSAAARKPKVEHAVTTASDRVSGTAGKVGAGTRRRVGLQPKTIKEAKKGHLERAVEGVSEHARTPKLVRAAVKPLTHNPKLAVLGAVVGSTVGGQAGGYVGYGHALKLERDRNAKLAARDSKHGVSKLVDKPLTDKQRHGRAGKKRLQANISTFTGLTGMGALAATAAGKIPRLKKLGALQTPLLTAGAGVGGVGSFNFARYTRDEANREDRPVRKAFGVPRVPRMRQATLVRTGSIVRTRRGGFSKAQTTMSEAEAAKLSHKYDTRGALPKGLSRPSRMKAYEARYISSGGRKGEKWHRRAQGAELARNVGVAGATASAAGVLAARTRLRGPLKKVPGLKKITRAHLEVAGLGSATAGGTAELYGEHARHKRASYANSPAGVAGSALTRMQNYTKVAP